MAAVTVGAAAAAAVVVVVSVVGAVAAVGSGANGSEICGSEVTPESAARLSILQPGNEDQTGKVRGKTNTTVAQLQKAGALSKGS